MNSAIIKFKYTEEGFVPLNEAESKKLTLYKKVLPLEGTIDAYFTLETPADRTLGQLAKVHALIKEIADESGNSAEDVKDDIKRKAGLYVVTETSDLEFKSFKDCSKKELSKAIECCIELGSFLGYHLS